jgi:hypothetical protein
MRRPTTVLLCAQDLLTARPDAVVTAALDGARLGGRQRQLTRSIS